MNPVIMILMGVVMMLCFVMSQVYAIRSKMAGLERKLNMLLAGMGIDPQSTDFIDASINRIVELYRTGQASEAKQLAKDTLTSPADFKKFKEVLKTVHKESAKT